VSVTGAEDEFMTKTAELPATDLSQTQSIRWTDARLVRGCVTGNHDAWSALVGKYKNLIFSIPLKYGFSREEAADIFQVVCTELLSQLPRFRDARDLPKWIVKATALICYHRKREEPNNQPRAGEISRWFQEPLPPEAERIVHMVEPEQALRNAMSELTPQCRQLVRSLFFEQPARSYEEIAQELGLARNSLRFARQPSLGQLRRKLGKSKLFEPSGAV
jgi:RNA polymerase sigma factor (sigma-70 family)